MSFKVVVIVKVSNDKFLKYHVSNLLLFTSLDRKFPEWKYFNVYNKKRSKFAPSLNTTAPLQPAYSVSIIVSPL